MSLFPRKKVLIITLYIMIITKSTKGKFREKYIYIYIYIYFSKNKKYCVNTIII